MSLVVSSQLGRSCGEIQTGIFFYSERPHNASFKPSQLNRQPAGFYRRADGHKTSLLGKAPQYRTEALPHVFFLQRDNLLHLGG